MLSWMTLASVVGEILSGGGRWCCDLHAAQFFIPRRQTNYSKNASFISDTHYTVTLFLPTSCWKKVEKKGKKDGGISKHPAK